jgi:uncharacterized membrane protein YagU involved in acid resistance
VAAVVIFQGIVGQVLASGFIKHGHEVVIGTRDTTVPPSEGELAAERIPDAQLVRFHGVGHQPVDERPEEFDRLLLDFIRSYEFSWHWKLLRVFLRIKERYDKGLIWRVHKLKI